MPTAVPSVSPVQEAREKAVVLTRVGRYRESAHYCHLALADAPNDAELLCRLAYAYYRLGEPWRAGLYVDKALAADPNNERVHRLSCLLVLGQGKKAAVDAALRATELAPAGRNPWYLLTQSYLAAKDWENARQSVIRLREIAPEWAPTHLLLGKVAFQLEKKDAAEKSVRAALALDPESTDAHLLLGQILYAQNKPYEAADAYLCATKLQPNRRAARVGLLLCVLSARRTVRLCLDLLLFAGVLTVCLLPALHFRSWQSCVVGFLVFPVIGFVKLLKSRHPLSPDVEAAWRSEKSHPVRLLFMCLRSLMGRT